MTNDSRTKQIAALEVRFYEEPISLLAEIETLLVLKNEGEKIEKNIRRERQQTVEEKKA